MNTRIAYIVYEVSPCKLGTKYRMILEFWDEADALDFIDAWNVQYDYSFICLKLMKVLTLDN